MTTILCKSRRRNSGRNVAAWLAAVFTVLSAFSIEAAQDGASVTATRNLIQRLE